ncbi:MAG: hypothetical protein AAGG53_03695 [Cyanobacteria bacterium P01_H01_bin.152]
MVLVAFAGEKKHITDSDGGRQPAAIALDESSGIARFHDETVRIAYALMLTRVASITRE